MISLVMLLTGVTLLPQSIDPSALYVIYVHGAWPERHELAQPHPQFGKYKVHAVAKALEKQGVTVLYEVRKKPVQPARYAQNLAREVQRLIVSGVPPDHILLVGHSKGGMIVLLSSLMIDEPKMHYAILAGCAPNWHRTAARVKDIANKYSHYRRGEYLSLWADSDTIAGSCKPLLKDLQVPKMAITEKVLKSSKGHGLFYAPDSIWLNPLIQWFTQK